MKKTFPKSFATLALFFLWPFLSHAQLSGGSGPAPVNDSLIKIAYNGISVNVVIAKPDADTADALLIFHGTVTWDSLIVPAAYTALNKVRNITTIPNILFVSVAYPEEGLLMGDNIRQSEAALLWLKNMAPRQLNIYIRKVFLVGHSQGGYIVTRLNTLHKTDGVVANAPGPLNLKYRCTLEENRQINSSAVCDRMREEYGSVLHDPGPYIDRSLLNYTSDHKGDILFIQGMKDAPIQMASYPLFKKKLESCISCKSCQFYEAPDYGHTALFESPGARIVFNQFLTR